MGDHQERGGCGITVFRPGTPSGVKTRAIIFFIILCAIILVQCCYWLFANSIHPFIWGMPFGLFFVVLFVIIEFVVLLLLYFLEAKDAEEGGGA
jgi:phosphoglycerol transferase MdoB-like AlkP superfamily enzyme